MLTHSGVYGRGDELTLAALALVAAFSPARLGPREGQFQIRRTYRSQCRRRRTVRKRVLLEEFRNRPKAAFEQLQLPRFEGANVRDRTLRAQDKGIGLGTGNRPAVLFGRYEIYDRNLEILSNNQRQGQGAGGRFNGTAFAAVQCKGRKIVIDSQSQGLPCLPHGNCVPTSGAELTQLK